MEKLYLEVRKLLTKGLTINQTIISLEELGYSKESILQQIKKFYNNEKDYNDEIMTAEIERRFHKGQPLQKILHDLIEEGNRPFVVEMATLGAELAEGQNMASMMKRWELASYINIMLFFLTMALAFFYNKLFFIGLGMMLLTMIISSLQIPYKYKDMDTEITVMPLGGLYMTQGVWGYNKILGNYFRWWIIEPSTVYMAFFVIFGIMFTPIYGIIFFLFSMLLIAFSLVMHLVSPRK